MMEDFPVHISTGGGSSVGSVSALQAAVPLSISRSVHSFVENNFPLLLIRKDLVVSYWR